MSGGEGTIVQFDNVGLRYGTEREVLSREESALLEFLSESEKLDVGRAACCQLPVPDYFDLLLPE